MRSMSAYENMRVTFTRLMQLYRVRLANSEKFLSLVKSEATVLKETVAMFDELPDLIAAVHKHPLFANLDVDQRRALMPKTSALLKLLPGNTFTMIVDFSSLVGAYFSGNDNEKGVFALTWFILLAYNGEIYGTMNNPELVIISPTQPWDSEQQLAATWVGHFWERLGFTYIGSYSLGDYRILVKGMLLEAAEEVLCLSRYLPNDKTGSIRLMFESVRWILPEDYEAALNRLRDAGIKV
jgi:hypothetical protein